MTAQQDLSANKAEKEADAPQEPDTDRQGYVTISKGDAEAKIVPSSLSVWEDQGWSLVKSKKKEN